MQKTNSFKNELTNFLHSKNKNLMLVLCASLIWQELIFRFCTNNAFFSVGTIYAAMFAVPIGLLLWLIVSLFSGKLRMVFAFVFNVFFFVLFASQAVYYAVFYTYYTTFSAGNGAQVTAFMSVIISSIIKQSFYILLLGLPIVLMAVLAKKGLFNLEKHNFKIRLKVGIVAIAFQIIATACLLFAGVAQNSPFALYFQTRVLTASVDKLGLITTMRHDLADLIFGFEEKTTWGIDKKSLQIETATETTTETTQAQKPESEKVVRTPQVLDIDLNALANSETNQIIAQLHSEFAEKEPTYTNENTGLFEGKNLIYIVAESFSPYAIDKERTPTLYKMQQDGWQFPNFYTGIWGVSTLDGEYVATQGLIPKQGVWSMYQSGKNYLPFTLGNEFLAKGATTYAYHNGTYDYYSRQDSHPNMGYTYKGVNGGLEMTNEWPRSDKELVEVSIEDYINEDYFHVYYLTISGHLPYDNTNTQALKNEDKVADLPYSDTVKKYLASNIELDKAMEYLLAELEKAGKLDDTVIVISPDHYPYGLTLEQMNELAGHELETEFELYKSTLIIYNSQTKGEEVTKYCSSLDILPTVLNLFNLPYDSRMLAGQDIFSDSEGFVPFVTKSFITDKVMYNAGTNVATPLTKEEVTEEYISEANKKVSDAFSQSRRILENNYYNYLGLN